MEKFLKSFALAAIFFSVSNNALAIAQGGITVGLAGMENNGSSVFVQIIPNPNACLYSGVYFSDQAGMDKALSIALSAKMAGKTIRIDYVQTGGYGNQCLGYGMYVE